MKIKNNVEWYIPLPQCTFGYVDFDGEIQTDCTDECTEQKSIWIATSFIFQVCQK